MDNEDQRDSDANQVKRAFIPHITDNKKGLKKFFGMVLLAAMFNQAPILFERNMTEAYKQYFSSGGGLYEPEFVRIWYFSVQFLTSLISLWVITKIQPTFFYGIAAIVLGLS
jgi:hypothetical protein